MTSDDDISNYSKSQSSAHSAICNALRAEIDSVLSKATSKIWHAMPVWFVGENPVVGYKASAKHVNLLFWNGQEFQEEALTPAGKFKAAQIKFTDVSEVDVKSLRRWLKKAGTKIWNYQGLRKKGKRAGES